MAAMKNRRLLLGSNPEPIYLGSQSFNDSVGGHGDDDPNGLLSEPLLRVYVLR